MSINTKNIIKIPHNISIFYCPEKKVMIIKGPQSKNFLKLDVDISLKEKSREIWVSSKADIQKCQNNFKKIQGTTTALIKQLIYGTLTNICLKVMLVGIGYKAFHIPDSNDTLLQFRLGFSHSLFFKIPESIKITCLKSTKLFIYGNSYYDVTQVALKIRRKKIPEPYKGKGIKYENEKIMLKGGKKV
jgi:large subunit ribosomal protein L6